MTWTTGYNFVIPGAGFTTGYGFTFVAGPSYSTTLFWDASGQLVIAASLPPGGSYVTDPASAGLADVAPWMRDLDSSGSTAWHPANYYSGGPESAAQAPGGNLMPNADLAFGIDYWAILNVAGGGTNYSNPTLDMNGNTPAGVHTVGISRTGTTLAASDTLDIIYTKPVNVLPSTYYEQSAFMAASNCAASIFVNFYKLVASVETLISASSVFAAAAAAGGDDLSGWALAGGFFTTPADCQYVKFCIRGSAASAADPKFWATKLFLGQATPGQTELSAWQPGGSSGAYGELATLTSTHENYVASVTVPNLTLTELIALTFTSIISPTRERKLLISFFCESSTYTTYVEIVITSGAHSETKVLYNSANNMSARILPFTIIATIPAGYDASITISVSIKQDFGSSRPYEQNSIFVMEIPT